MTRPKVSIELSEINTDRADIVKDLLDTAWVMGSKYSAAEAIGVLLIALACAERGVNLKPGQSNAVLREMRRSVNEAIRRLGDEATAQEIVLELALLG